MGNTIVGWGMQSPFVFRHTTRKVNSFVGLIQEKYRGECPRALARVSIVRLYHIMGERRLGILLDIERLNSLVPLRAGLWVISLRSDFQDGHHPQLGKYSWSSYIP